MFYILGAVLFLVLIYLAEHIINRVMNFILSGRA